MSQYKYKIGDTVLIRSGFNNEFNPDEVVSIIDRFKSRLYFKKITKLVG